MILKFAVFAAVALIFWFSEYQPIAWVMIAIMAIKLIDLAHKRAGGKQTVTIKQNKTETGN